MGKRSKDKGAAFERSIARKLSLWLSGGERDDLLWRSAASGGRATMQMRKGEVAPNQAGDLSPIGYLGYNLLDHFIIECKHYKLLYLEDMVYGIRKGDGIGAFWDQACNDGISSSKQPIVVAKQNYQQPIICLNTNLVWGLNKPSVVFTHSERLKASIGLLDSFLNSVTPDHLVNTKIEVTDAAEIDNGRSSS